MLHAHELDHITDSHDAACDAALSTIVTQRQAWEHLARLATAQVAALKAIETSIAEAFVNEHYQKGTS